MSDEKRCVDRTDDDGSGIVILATVAACGALGLWGWQYACFTWAGTAAVLSVIDAIFKRFTR